MKSAYVAAGVNIVPVEFTKTLIASLVQCDIASCSDMYQDGAAVFSRSRSLITEKGTKQCYGAESQRVGLIARTETDRRAALG